MADTRENILNTALRLFARDGYEAVSVSAIAGALGICEEQVSVKGKTEEGLGFTGLGEGMAAHAVCILEKD